MNDTMDDVSSIQDTPTKPPAIGNRWAIIIRSLSDRLAALQRPIRVLQAVKWDDSIERDFFARDARELPRVKRETYASNPLALDPGTTIRELGTLARDVGRQLGPFHPAGGIMLRMCREYRQLVELLRARGTGNFGAFSRLLYGTTRENNDYAMTLSRMFPGGSRTCGTPEESRRLDATQVVCLLRNRLGRFFGARQALRIRLSDDIVADAAAGLNYLKIRRGARFSPRDVGVLEVHEGWVHLGTTLNALSQPICTFLTKGPPSSTITQEGLAVFTELHTGACHPGRIRRLVNRVEAIALAERGADFLDVYRFFLELGDAPRESYRQAMRVFRGSLPAGVGPFTKDLAYAKGLLIVAGLVKASGRNGRAGWLPLLFCGKTRGDDLAALAQLASEGLISRPRFVPPPFALKGLQC